MQQTKFQLFDKYDFVKSYVSISHPTDAKAKDEREAEAALIANAIKDRSCAEIIYPINRRLASIF